MTARPDTVVRFMKAYGVALIVLGALDAVWLGWLARDFYRDQLASLMTDSVRLAPAALYYLLYPLAIVYLAIWPAARLGQAVARSAALGLAAFGVYDLTNLATLRGYTFQMTVVDMAWGAFASAVGGTTAFALVIGRHADRGTKAVSGLH